MFPINRWVVLSAAGGIALAMFIYAVIVVPVGKTLWDWLELLIVPLALLVGTVIFDQLNKTRDSERQAKRQREQELRQEDHYREEALQKYFDQIDKLILTTEHSDAAMIHRLAASRTITVLRRLEGMRLQEAVDFLRATETIRGVPSVSILQGKNLQEVDMDGVDLSYFDLEETRLVSCKLRGADLSGAFLHNAVLSYADLSYADLNGADLRGAILTEAVLDNTYLAGTNLTGAIVTPEQLAAAIRESDTIMPDGKPYTP